MTDVEIAWAAGLFEGEGSITLRPTGGGRPGLQRHIQVAMADRDVIEKFHRTVGAGRIYVEDRSKYGTKTLYRWSCGRWKDIERLLAAFLPHFGVRRSAKAREMLMSPARRVGGVVKAVCRRGHPLEGAGADVYTWKNVRHCRHCTRTRIAERKKARA